MSKLTRGIRNNNPMNIRKGSQWLGLSSDSHLEQDFCVFTDIRYGLRAALYILTKYVYVYHVDSIKDIIARWAPPTENDTLYYVRSILILWPRKINSDYRISSIEDLVYLLSCMCYIESRYSLTEDVFDASFNLLPNKMIKLWKK